MSVDHLWVSTVRFTRLPRPPISGADYSSSGGLPVCPATLTFYLVARLWEGRELAELEETLGGLGLRIALRTILGL